MQGIANRIDLGEKLFDLKTEITDTDYNREFMKIIDPPDCNHYEMANDGTMIPYSKGECPYCELIRLHNVERKTAQKVLDIFEQYFDWVNDSCSYGAFVNVIKNEYKL